MKMIYGNSAALLFQVFALLILSSCQKENDLTSVDRVLSPSKSSARDSIYMILSATSKAVNSKIGGYYQALPSNYDKTTQVYPLLVYMHGAGQIGNGNSDLSLLLKDGVAQVINDKKFPGTFT